MNDPTEFWTGQGGDEYHQRNWVDWQLRVPFWEMICKVTGARSFLEFGCGPGWNLTAIKRVWSEYYVTGIEINQDARWQGNQAGLFTRTEMPKEFAELVFTAGCLIHIPPQDIESVMQQLCDASLRYVLAIEYMANEEEEVEYRGQKGLLWKRPYGSMYEDMGLTLVDAGYLPKKMGFDDVTWWLLEK